MPNQSVFTECPDLTIFHGDIETKARCSSNEALQMRSQCVTTTREFYPHPNLIVLRQRINRGLLFPQDKIKSRVDTIILLFRRETIHMALKEHI